MGLTLSDGLLWSIRKLGPWDSAMLMFQNPGVIVALRVVSPHGVLLESIVIACHHPDTP